MSASEVATPPSRLQRLLSFLQEDAANLSLLGDAAAAALDEGELDQAAALVDAYGQIAPLPPNMVNLEGLLALRTGRFGDAVRIFSALLDAAPADPVLRLNLGWAQVMERDYQSALVSLDDAATAALAAAAALRIQAMHHLGLIEEALECGQALAKLHPQDSALMSSLAVLAIDAERPDLARDYAQRAGPTHEGLSTLGVLTLSDNKIDEAASFFDGALSVQPKSARALVGKGLVLIAKGDAPAAADWLAQGAEIFGDHLGSWIAVGWAQFAAGDYAAARSTFEKTLALDDTFAESHGALAVMDVLNGDLPSASRRAEVAERLDRRCFSAALARSLILSGQGDGEKAQRVRDIALNTPVGPGGQTLAQAMVALGIGFGAAS